MRFASAALIVVALVASGCGKTATSPTDTTPLTTAELYAGTIGVNSSGFYSFAVNVKGTVKVTFASLAVSAGGTPVSTVMGIGIGIPTGTGCSLLSSKNVAPGLVAQLTQDLDPSIYCAKIFDVGNLTSTLNFTVRIVHP